MPTQVSVQSASTGAQTFYSTYASARSNANSGDLINIYGDLNEQIILKDGVDIWIAPGRLIELSSQLPTIIDNGVACNCKITGNGIIKNTYSGESRMECIKITNADSKIYIECDYLDGLGAPTSFSRNAATINIVHAAKFSIICNNICSHLNSAIIISDCNDFLIQCKTVESGTSGSTNVGPAVIYIYGSGSIYLDEIICNGYGSCIEQVGGTVNANILKLTTITNSTAANPTILVNGGGSQILNLTFDEIQNLNSTDGDAVTISEGTAKLIGRRIYSYKGLSLDLGANANIKCNEIVSGAQGVNIHNSLTQKIIIDADYIEGSIGNTAVIKSDVSSNYTIRNAKVKNINTSSSSIGMYVNAGSTIELENVIVVTGNVTSGESILCTWRSNSKYS